MTAIHAFPPLNEDLGEEYTLDPEDDKRDKTPMFVQDGEDCVVTNLCYLEHDRYDKRPSVAFDGPVSVYMPETQKAYLVMLKRRELHERTFYFTEHCIQDMARAARNLLTWRRKRSTIAELNARQQRLHEARETAKNVTTHSAASYLYYQKNALIQEGVMAEVVQRSEHISRRRPATYKVQLTDAFIERNRAVLQEAGIVLGKRTAAQAQFDEVVYE